MRLLLAVLPAAICLAQTSDLPSQLARLQRLPTDQVRSLEARLAMDPAPTDKKAYHQLHLAYVLASRLSTELKFHMNPARIPSPCLGFGEIGVLGF